MSDRSSLLTWTRHLLALLAVAYLAFDFFRGFSVAAAIRTDPGTAALLSLSLLGLALRCFWGRFLTISLCSVLTALAVPRLLDHLGDCSPSFPLQALAGAAPILLLAGSRMRAHFEGRPGRLNRWAGASRRVYALRWLVLTQAFALEMLYLATRLDLPWTAAAWPFIALIGLGLVGLTLQRTWGLLLMLLGSLGQLAAAFITFAAVDGGCSLRGMGLSLALGLLGLLSLVQLLPYVRAAVRLLRR